MKPASRNSNRNARSNARQLAGSRRSSSEDAHQLASSRRTLPYRDVVESDSDGELEAPTRSRRETRARGTMASLPRKTLAQEEKERKEKREKERVKRRKEISIEIDVENCKVGVRDPNAIPFSDDTKKMKQKVKRAIKMITYKKLKKYLEAETKVRRGIKNDGQLKHFYKREIPMVPDAKNIAVDASTIHRNLQRKKAEMTARETRKAEEDEKGSRRNTQKPREEKSEDKRALVMTNFSRLNSCHIPVYCTLTKNPINCNVPDTLLLRYTDRIVHRDSELKQLEKFFEKNAHMIRCNCCSRTPIVKCWENEECPCYQMNVKLQKLQKDATMHGNDSLHPPTEFNTFNAIKLNVGSDDQTAGFACHEDCECRGSCTNNVLMLMEKMNSMNSVILERKNDKIGFQVTTENAVPFGTPIALFSGEVTTFWNRDPDSNEYIYKSYDPKYGNFGEKVSKLMGEWPSSLTKKMGKVYQKNWFIDPKIFGNIARMFNHNCDPNVALVRVFQKGFSPSQMKLVAVTLRDIFPGEEQTIDYGADYGRVLECRCGTLSCHSTPFRDLTQGQIASILKKERSKKAKEYHTTILPKLNRAGGSTF